MKRRKWTAAALSAMMVMSSFAGMTAMTEENTTESTTEAVADSESSAVDVVTVEGGQVQGVESDVEGVQVFKGIPFAADTSGVIR